VDPALPNPAYEQFCLALRDCEPRLRARAFQLTRNAADAHDLTQRTLERGLRHLHQFESGTNLRVWLTRIMMNLFIDDCRRAASAPRLEPLNDASVALDIPQPGEEEPECPWLRITTEQLQKAMAALPPLFRQIYELRVRDGLRYRQIAARLDIPSGTVATRLGRARKRLRGLLAPLAGDRDDQGDE
jgi:RNA polymerase sigma-70 factor (ECF subfamily)